MSGGSYDYAYHKVEDFADSFCTGNRKTPLRQAFAKHLKLVIQAMHDIEWVDSGDCSEGSENAAIIACVPNHKLMALDASISDAIKARDALIKAIEDASKI